MNTGIESYYPVYGDGTLARPKAYDPSLKWETTTSYNVGLDWGILKQRLTGSVDWYYRKTSDLLNSATVSAGSNFRNQVMSNIGSMYNTGVEASIHWLAVNAKDFNWTMDYNFTYNYNKITNLNGGNDADYFVPTGGISAGTGGNIQAQHVGNAVNSFHVFQQVYDKSGKPIEGVVVDRNGDGKITDADKYYYKAPAAPVTMGFASRFEYRNWDLGFALRASLGNYVYNDAFASVANMSNSELFSKSKYLVNRPTDVLADNWQTTETKSIQTDYWVRNASFLKMDNVTLGYSFANLLKQGTWNGISGRVYGTVNNVFCLTKYKGLDPEVFNGIDNNLYPRPISFILGLNLNF